MTRPLALAALVACSGASLPSRAQHTPVSHAPQAAQARDAEASPAPPAPRSRGGPYAGWLVAGYAGGAAVGVGTGLASMLLGAEKPLSLGLGIGLTLLAPVVVHAVHHEGLLALRTFVGWPLSVVAGGVCGLLLGGLAYALAGDDASGTDYVLGGVMVGGAVGALAWPIGDVVDAYARDEHRARRVAFGVVPQRDGALGVLRVGF